MAFKRILYEFENVIEVEEYLDGRYGAPGQKRAERKKATPNDIARVNQWNKSKKARHRLRKYFNVNDYFITLTYRPKDRPKSMKECKEHFRKFYKYVGKEYKKRGYELRWIRNIELGVNNNWHIHVVLNRIPDTDIILGGAWEQYGSVKNRQLLYEKGEFKDLADYITKDEKTEALIEHIKDKDRKKFLDHKIVEANYSTSRNMPLPEPKVKKLKHWPKEPKSRKGFYIDKDSLFEGENKFTKCPYRHYEMIRLERSGKRAGGNLHRHRYKGDETEESPLCSDSCSKGKKRGRRKNEH